MRKTKALPEIIKKKKIDLKKFENLAKKVKKSFEKEAEYLEEQQKQYADHNLTRILSCS